MIRLASIFFTLTAAAALAWPAHAEPQGFQGRPHGGSTPGQALLWRHGMTAAQYNKMRMKPKPIPMPAK